MSDIFDLFTAFSRPLQAGWILWLACTGLLMRAAWGRGRRRRALVPVSTVSIEPVAVPDALSAWDSERAITGDVESEPPVLPVSRPPVEPVTADPALMAAPDSEQYSTLPSPTAAVAEPAEAEEPPFEPAPQAEAERVDATLREFEAALEFDEEMEDAGRSSRGERKRNRRGRRGTTRAA